LLDTVLGILFNRSHSFSMQGELRMPELKPVEEAHQAGDKVLVYTKEHVLQQGQALEQLPPSRQRPIKAQAYCVPAAHSVLNHHSSKDWSQPSDAFRRYFKGSKSHTAVRVLLIRISLHQNTCLQKLFRTLFGTGDWCGMCVDNGVRLCVEATITEEDFEGEIG
jgi:hypothetical protein